MNDGEWREERLHLAAGDEYVVTATGAMEIVARTRGDAVVKQVRDAIRYRDSQITGLRQQVARLEQVCESYETHIANEALERAAPKA